MKALINNSDKFGVMANVLCMAHCLATPLLFISQAHNSTLVHEIPFLWQLTNYFFLLISFVAVYFSIKKSTKLFVKIFLMIFWLSLSFLIINEGLEGFHIPFVHKDLNEVLDYNIYKTEVYDHCNLQIGYSEDDTDVFNLPKDHLDYGKNVAAYYYWVFPNMMFNFYPWGLSINIVKPISDIDYKPNLKGFAIKQPRFTKKMECSTFMLDH